MSDITIYFSSKSSCPQGILKGEYRRSYLTQGCDNKEKLSTENSIRVKSQELLSLLLLPFICYAAFTFSKAFPRILWSKSVLYYIPAQWEYNEENTHFDNTILTWGTDYILAVIMSYGSWKCLSCKQMSLTDELRHTSFLLFFLYFVSVLSGGVAHQYFRTLDSLNSTSFRFLWFVCVSTVAMAGGAIGAVGSKLCKAFDEMGVESYFNVMILPDSFWFGWSIMLTLFCANGDMSYYRPAADIFIAGTTQIFPTVYVILITISHKWSSNNSSQSDTLHNFLKLVTVFHLILLCVSFLLNAPLLPAYPLLLHMKLPAGVINALLHCNLLVAWGSQCYSVYRLSLAFANAEDEKTLNKKIS